jgi:hypothetical protein
MINTSTFILDAQSSILLIYVEPMICSYFQLQI